MHFLIVGQIAHVETFAAGSSILEIGRLRKIYGKGRWRKRKGIASIRWKNGKYMSRSLTTMLRSMGSCESSMNPGRTICIHLNYFLRSCWQHGYIVRSLTRPDNNNSFQRIAWPPPVGFSMELTYFLSEALT
jgi:hypothetical protein